MGRLVEGRWTNEWYDTKATAGRFQREDAKFRDWIRADGSTPYGPEAGRYHLYVSYACPWAHRTLVVRALKGLAGAVSVSAVEPLMLEHGWTFAPGADHLFGYERMYQVYQRAKPDMTGRVTVPVLWDTRLDRLVNNESSEIIRMFDGEFGALASGPTLYPEALRAEIDAVNARVYATVNNGVYRAGFATTQAAYDEAYVALFDTLDWLEARLEGHDWLVGDQLTEADIRLWTTLVRFDAVYHGHFKCNRNRLVEMPNLTALVRRVYHLPGVAETVRIDVAKEHYYGSHATINPTGIIPRGPALDFGPPPER